MNNFLKTPYIPEHDVKTVVVDYRVPFDIESKLSEMGISIIKTSACNELYDAINGHPDIIMQHISENNVIVAPNVYNYLAPILEKKGFAVTTGSTWLNRNYPCNIAYNVLRVGSVAFHNSKYTDLEILKAFEKNNVKLVHVNQGYTKCSVCIVDSKTIITSDKKIAKEAEKYNIECLFISPGGISLKGLDYGFIGGASGLIAKKQLAFSGELAYHPDKEKIYDFLNQKGINVKILSQKQIIDIGSIIPLNY